MIAVIINPLSGSRGRGDPAPGRVTLATQILKTRGLDPYVRVSEYPRHAITLTEEAVARGATMVCAWGGDGTLNEVGSALVNTEVPLGIIPAGSGNGLARELGMHVKPEAAFAIALDGRDRRIDAGEVAGRLFFNIAGFGLDARVAAEFNTLTPDRRGFARYIGVGWRQLLTYRAEQYHLEVDGEPLDRSAIMVVLANLRQYGNGAYIAPHAEPDDGRLDLVVVEARSTIPALLLTPRLFTGSLDRASGVLTRRAGTIRISSDTPLLCHVDGEAFMAGREATATVRPLALRVRVGR